MINHQFVGLISILLLVKYEFSSGLSLSYNPPECGRRINEIRGEKSNKIFGGNKANPEDWGWQTLLLITIPSGRYSMCGGSLINSEWVITAAHCLYVYLKKQQRFYEVQTEDIELKFGLHDRSNPESYSTIRKVSKIIVHPDYDTRTLKMDIALLKLNEPLNYTKHILPICLPEFNSDFSGKLAWATGWGNTNLDRESAIISNYLMEVDINIHKSSACTTILDYPNNAQLPFDPANEICAGGSGKSTCNGDSGGPLVVKVGEKWQLAGISSWGLKLCSGTAVYAKTSSFINWIREPTASYSMSTFAFRLEQLFLVILTVLYSK